MKIIIYKLQAEVYKVHNYEFFMEEISGLE